MAADSSYIESIETIKVWGKVTRIVGLVIEGFCPHASIGSLCQLTPVDGTDNIFAEIVGFKNGKALLMPLGELRGLGPGSLIRVVRNSATIKVGNNLLGRVIDAMEIPQDGLPSPVLTEEKDLYSLPPGPLERENINQTLDLGISAINGFTTCGMGQRMGIMAGSGIGKSVLLGMMARYTNADINVIALIGERGREVREFIERDLGKDGLARSVIVAVTSDQPPLLRMRGAFVATAIAEYFSNQGKNVLLMMDSVTRFAMAMREIGLAVGEPPTTKGYTPSVFATLPKLLERAGKFKNRGTITGLYSVLVDGDDMTEPVADSVRSILDGHIVLSRKLASKNHFPAIDIINSTSRVMRNIVSSRHLELAGKAREVLANYAEAEDLINIGAYVKGSNSKIDYAINKIDLINDFLKQEFNKPTTLKESIKQLGNMLSNRKDEEIQKKNRRETDKPDSL
ncbi:MAG: FliI/YscN family ATPase [Deltaproteobacteria bacterium]|nr:FliI/YscN family ATPase [Deltaproteobacteria bacterium]MBW2659803.1 FliI/YscN family ATPase [Deltaproteobacteria bacterium]